jgi:hypothetical protein
MHDITSCLSHLTAIASMHNCKKYLKGMNNKLITWVARLLLRGSQCLLLAGPHRQLRQAGSSAPQEPACQLPQQQCNSNAISSSIQSVSKTAVQPF